MIPAGEPRSRPLGETAVEGRFLARCGFAWRHICRDAPDVAERYRDYMQEIIKKVPKVVVPVPQAQPQLVEGPQIRTPPGLAKVGRTRLCGEPSHAQLMRDGDRPTISEHVPQQFCIASDVGDDDDRWRALEDRMTSCEEAIGQLVVDIIHCPVPDLLGAGGTIGVRAEATMGTCVVAAGADGDARLVAEHDQLHGGDLGMRETAVVETQAVADGADGGAKFGAERNQPPCGGLGMREGAAVGACTVAAGTDGGARLSAEHDQLGAERNQPPCGDLGVREGAAVGARTVAAGADGGARLGVERDQLQGGDLGVRGGAAVGPHAVAEGADVREGASVGVCDAAAGAVGGAQLGAERDQLQCGDVGMREGAVVGTHPVADGADGGTQLGAKCNKLPCGDLGVAAKQEARRQQMIEGMMQLTRELEATLGNCDDIELLTDAQRDKYRAVSKASEHGHLEERRAARDLIEEARTDKGALRTALLAWVSNERKLRRLAVAMRWTQTADTSRERVVRGRVGKIVSAVGKKPRLLLELLDGVEQTQPWTDALASMVGELEKCLTRCQSSQSHV